MNEKVVNQIFSSLVILSIGIKTNNAKKINDIKTINKPSLNFQFLFFQFRLGKFSPHSFRVICCHFNGFSHLTIKISRHR